MTAPQQTFPALTPDGSTLALNANEVLVLRRVAEGCRYATISEEMCMSPKAARDIGVRLMRKLGAKNITHAVLLACQAGVLDGRPRRHGDHAGFAAHKYRGEEPCEKCWAGERAYRAEQKTRLAMNSDAA